MGLPPQEALWDSLGHWDYEHLTIDLSAMLLHQFHSLYHYFGQGFESSHKLHHQLFSRATNHDASGAGQSCKSITKKVTKTTHQKFISETIHLIERGC